MDDIRWENSVDKWVDVYQCLSGGARMYGDIVDRFEKKDGYYMLHLYYHNIWQSTNVSHNGWWVEIK